MAAWNDISKEYHYDSEVTKSSELYAEKTAVMAYSDLCKKEGGKTSAYKHEIIHIDAIPTSKRMRQLPATLDFLCGICKRQKCANMIQKGKGIHFLLGECRFNYKNPRNITKNDIAGKISGTRSLLSKDLSALFQKIVFLFPDTCVQEARSHLARLNPKQDWLAITQEAFQAIFD